MLYRLSYNNIFETNIFINILNHIDIISLYFYSVIGWKNATMPDGSINRAIIFKLKERHIAYTFVVTCLKGYVHQVSFRVRLTGEI